MRTSLQETLQKTGVMVIDGSMSTALEQLGCDLNDSLWTAKALDQQPELVRQVHENYFIAGADCGITCSYQATIPGLMAKGHTLAEAENLITRSVELFLEARELWQESAERTTRHMGVKATKSKQEGYPVTRVDILDHRG